MTSAQGFLFFLIVLGGAATLLRLLWRASTAVPYQVLLALGGIAIGFIPGLRLSLVGPDLILVVFVPGLVFEAALGLDLSEVRRRALPIGLLATVGVLLTVIVVGVPSHFALGLEWSSALLLGSIVAATDPIAVVSLLRQVGAPAGLKAILEGESLFNDGTGIAAFAAVLGTIVGGHPSVLDASFRFVVVTAGGTAIGIGVGVLGALLLSLVREAELEILITLVVAYGAYLAADVLSVSGVVSVVAAGIVVAVYGNRAARLKGTQLIGFWNVLSFVLNAVLFLVVGVALPAHRLAALAGLALVAYAVMFFGRAIPVYALLGMTDIRARSIAWSWRHLIFWGGMRGALSVALALSIASNPRVDPRVAVVAYGMVVLSLVVQGGLLVPASRILRISSDARVF